MIQEARTSATVCWLRAHCRSLLTNAVARSLQTLSSNSPPRSVKMPPSPVREVICPAVALQNSEFMLFLIVQYQPGLPIISNPTRKPSATRESKPLFTKTQEVDDDSSKSGAIYREHTCIKLGEVEVSGRVKAGGRE